MARRVVVVGGGFAGLHLVRRLEGILRPGEIELTLLDRHNYHLFTPLLYQVATGELPPHAVENAARETDPERRRALLSFVIVGAGPVGVELASSLRDLMDHSLRSMYPELDLAHDAKITLVDAGVRVLLGMDPRLARIAMTRL